MGQNCISCNVICEKCAWGNTLQPLVEKAISSCTHSGQLNPLQNLSLHMELKIITYSTERNYIISSDVFTITASTLSRDWGFQAPEIVGGQGRRGPHV